MDITWIKIEDEILKSDVDNLLDIIKGVSNNTIYFTGEALFIKIEYNNTNKQFVEQILNNWCYYNSSEFVDNPNVSDYDIINW